MTVSLGPKRLLGANTLLGASQFLGQGNTSTAKDIEWEVLFSTDDASVAIPTWTYIQADMRAFSTSRGRASELADVDAGTATITLNNRARTYDPTNASGPYYPNLRPMNRVWLRLRFNGDTLDVFKGWVERYEQQYPGTVDAVTIVSAVDEFKVLALRNLPTTDPPRETYADVVQFDVPGAYWPLHDDPASYAQNAAVGPSLGANSSIAASSIGGTLEPAIIGNNPDPYGAMNLADGQQIQTQDLGIGEVPDASSLPALTVELWVKPTTTPGSDRTFLTGPSTATGFQYSMTHTTANAITWIVHDSGGTNHSITGGSLVLNQWHHVVGVAGGSSVLLYLNGVQVASGSWSAVVKNNNGTPGSAVFQLTHGAAGVVFDFYLSDVAFYSYALPAGRVTAHYQAGVNRGFARGQKAGERIGGILDSISSQAPRNLLAGARPLAGQYAGNGQHSLDLLTEVKQAESVDAVLFTASDGTITFLDGGHRSTSPWDTAQCTFGDAGGSELDYMDIALDCSDSFIANRWDVTRENGTVQTASDTTSQSRYLTRPQSLTGLKLRDDSDAADVAADMLAKYKDPATRVLSIKPKTMDVNVIDAVFRLEIGDKIRVLLTPPGGGARFDQSLWIQSITVDATPQAIYPTVQLGVSPV